MNNEIAVVEQLPVIVENIKKIGEELTKRLNDLKLNELVCNEETRKSIKDLRAELKKEKEEFEDQRKTIKTKINEPYEIFNKTYESEIKTKYEEADLTLKTKIDEVENGIKDKARNLAIEFFEEYRTSKSIIQENYLKFEEINLSIGLDALTEKGALVKKVKDAIIESVDNVERDLETISNMQYSDEIKVEYLKHKKLSLAIKDVNDRHMVLNALKEAEEQSKEKLVQEEQVIEKVEEVLSAPVEETIQGQMTIDDFEETEEPNEEIYEMTFTVKATLLKLKELKKYLIQEGYINE